ncbi:hypothetical protein PM038_04105 [Halorubrum ezzemoulense]|uniref:hypothetical protein n=1 Tax=Halorubrum ezzemoulense TaxID=337243 RepID=UPI00232E1746|nr:hypothetical protein [Halorubrum ezzemoulense]MDB2284453.1 hypothetical protein [Halorubrum ezzemoulense]
MTEFQDAFAGETRHANQDQVDEFKSFNPESTREYTLSHPDGGRRSIELEKPLIVAMARENRYEPDCEEHETERCINAIFDEGLCDVAGLALETAGLNADSYKLYKLRGLMIRCTRNLGSFKALSDHLSIYSSRELEQFGLQAAYGQSTYRKAAKQLKKSGEYELLVDASWIAAHALFWNGLPIPDPVKDQYGLSYTLGPAADDFSDDARQVPLYELMNDLMEIVISHLDFDRGSNKYRELRSLLGIFATAAITNESIEKYEQAAQHLFQLDTAFSDSTIWHHIDGLSVWEIHALFNGMYQELLEYVLDTGVVSEPVTVAYDLVNIQNFGREVRNDTFLTDDGRWRFASLSFTDTDLEFAFGLRLLKSEAQRTRVLKNFLRELTQMVDVKLFLADRGFDGVDDIEACRAFVPQRWAIHAQDASEKNSGSTDYTRLLEEIELDGTTVIPDAGFEELHPPTQLLGYSGVSTDEGSSETDKETSSQKLSDSVRAFWSDIPLPDDQDAREQRITNLNFQYNQRAKIETQFRLTKNRFDVATGSANPAHKLFYYNISTLFYNLYKIVDTIPSPKRGVEFDPTQLEVLNVIRNLSFGGPTCPVGLRHLQDTT